MILQPKAAAFTALAPENPPNQQRASGGRTGGPRGEGKGGRGELESEGEERKEVDNNDDKKDKESRRIMMREDGNKGKGKELKVRRKRGKRQGS